MDSFAKSMDLLNALRSANLIVHAADRLEIKRQRSGHFRLYAHLPGGLPVEKFKQVEPLAIERGMTANPFTKAGQVQHITFVDDDEDA